MWIEGITNKFWNLKETSQQTERPTYAEICSGSLKSRQISRNLFGMLALLDLYDIQSMGIGGSEVWQTSDDSWYGHDWKSRRNACDVS